MQRAALGLSVLAMVIGGWVLFLSHAAPRPHFEKHAPSGVETIARSFTEPVESAHAAVAWKLKRPYPAPAELETALGKPDDVSSGYTWSTKFIWRNSEGETVAWFNKADGLLDALDLNYGGLERIARSHSLPARTRAREVESRT